MACVSGSGLSLVRDYYQGIIERCVEVLDWKNKNKESVFAVGGEFDTSSPLFIICFNDNGVLVTNNTQTVLVSYEELSSDKFKDSYLQKIYKNRLALKEGRL